MKEKKKKKRKKKIINFLLPRFDYILEIHNESYYFLHHSPIENQYKKH